MLTRSEIDARLEAIELELPHLMEDMNSFFREFEDRTDQLCAEVDEAHTTYVLNRLNAMVNHAGVNG